MGMRLGLWRAGAPREWPRERAALRLGGEGRSVVWRHALPLWARSGVTPFPFGACPSVLASAGAAYRGKPNDWSGMVQRTGTPANMAG